MGLNSGYNQMFCLKLKEFRNLSSVTFSCRAHTHSPISKILDGGKALERGGDKKERKKEKKNPNRFQVGHVNNLWLYGRCRLIDSSWTRLSAKWFGQESFLYVLLRAGLSGRLFHSGVLELVPKAWFRFSLNQPFNFSQPNAVLKMQSRNICVSSFPASVFSKQVLQAAKYLAHIPGGLPSWPLCSGDLVPYIALLPSDLLWHLVCLVDWGGVMCYVIKWNMKHKAVKRGGREKNRLAPGGELPMMDT